ncbi:MAG: hypothetical protein K2P86_02750 [Xanthobacteraceae bacterium]|jgi:hypothetical protein|nr:hypothetical protein [Xanthobacteraceae bacterium]
MWIKGALLAVGLSLAFIAPATTAQAQQVTFAITNDSGRDIQIEFYSEDRNHAWPGGNQAYNLARARDDSWTLNCRRGEKICYGGWVKGDSRTYWGVGLNRKYSCSACCVTCDGGTLRRTLTPPQ